jgi:tetratricopeptide (TPR) repeat protein
MVYYNLQNFPEALMFFKQSYQNHQDPALLFNIGQCQRQLGQYEAAARSYRAFISQSPSAPNRDQARQFAEQMDDAAKRTRAAQEAPPTTPLSSAAWPAVGESQPATVEQRHAPTTRRPWYKNGAGWGVAAGGALAMFAGGALLGVAAGEGQQASSATAQSGFDLHHGNDLTYQRWGWPLLGIGGAAVMTGTLVLVLVRR